MKHKHLFKVVILGDSSVGKTSILQQFVTKQFSAFYKATVGADFGSKELTIDDTTLTLQIWDTAGQQRYQSLGGVFYKGTDCCVIVFDLTDRTTFKNVDKWKTMFFEHCSVKNQENFPIVLIGNKVDLIQGRQVTEGEVRAWQEKGKNIAYYETSAKNSINVEKAFHTVGRMALNYSMNEPKLVPESVILSKQLRRSRSRSCC